MENKIDIPLDMLKKKQADDDAAGPEPSLEGTPPGTLSEAWIKWYMARYRCIREVAILEGEDRLAIKGRSLKKGFTPPGNKQ